MIFKTHKQDNFSVISNELARNALVSSRAKGLYYYLMTLPTDWAINKRHVYTVFKEGRTAMDSAWSELEEAGYIVKVIERNDNKICGTHYDVYEDSVIVQKAECTKSTPTKQLTKIVSTKKDKTSKTVNSGKFIIPTIEEIDAYIKLQGYLTIDSSKFFNYYEAGGWTVTRGGKQVPMKSWKGTLATWHGRDRTSAVNIPKQTSQVIEIKQEDLSKAGKKWGEIKNG